MGSFKKIINGTMDSATNWLKVSVIFSNLLLNVLIMFV